MKTYKAVGIVLKRRNLGEADKILTIFTKQFGKKVLLARGIRKIISRRAPHLESFSLISYIAHTGKTFDLITETASFDNFNQIRNRLERVGFVYIALELVDRLTAENQESLPLFTLLSNFLNTLNSVNTSRTAAQQALVTFKTHILVELGFGERDRILSSSELDHTIESILESTLWSPNLLTRIQSQV